MPPIQQPKIGDIFGLDFPSCPAPYPHCGLLVKIFEGEDRSFVVSKKGFIDVPNAHLCMFIMISHGTPPRGEYAEQIKVHQLEGSLLDTTRSLYICYDHSEVGFIPGAQRRIASVNGSYLLSVDEAVAKYFLSQFVAVKRHKAQGGSVPPRGVIRG